MVVGGAVNFAAAVFIALNDFAAGIAFHGVLAWIYGRKKGTAWAKLRAVRSSNLRLIVDGGSVPRVGVAVP